MTRARDVANIDGVLTTTGDMYVASAAATPARLGIGSTGQVLTVAGGTASWATPSGGGGMTLLSTTTLSGASTTISSIPSAYNSLYAVIKNFGPSGILRIAPNDVSNWAFGTGSSNTGTTTVTTYGVANDYIKSPFALYNGNNNQVLILNDYGTTNYTQIPFQLYGGGYNSAGNQEQGYHLIGALRSSELKITSLTFYNSGGNFTTGTVYLYGVK